MNKNKMKNKLKNKLKWSTILLLVLPPLLLPLAFAGQYYEFTLVYNAANLSYNTLHVVEREYPSFQEGGYIAETKDARGKLLNLTFFDIPRTLYYDSFDEEGNILGGGVLEKNYTEVTIQTPYYSTAALITIYDKDITHLTKQLVIPLVQKREKSVLLVSMIVLLAVAILLLLFARMKKKR